MLIVKIGGPAYRIGMGGGAASSIPSGSNKAELDFNAVQVHLGPSFWNCFLVPELVVHACACSSLHQQMLVLNQMRFSSDCAVLAVKLFCPQL